MSYKAPKFLLGGVNLRRNFFGLNTMITGVYGAGETIIKLAPIFGLIYGVSKLLTFNSLPFIRKSNISLCTRKRSIH